MMKDIASGTAYLKKGFLMIKYPGIKRYVFIPLVLNIILFGGLIWLGYTSFKPIMEWMISWLPDWLAFLQWLMWAIVGSMTTIIVFFTFTPIANIVAAPFNAIMAEKIEEKLTGQDINSNVSLLTIIKDSLMSQLGKLIYILLWSAGLFLIGFIPVINLISPFLWVVFGSWLLTLEYMDYPMGNHDLNFKQQKGLVKSRRGLALGFGGGVMIMTSIPIINFIAMPVAVAGATIMWVEEFSDSPQANTDIMNNPSIEAK